MESRPTDEIGVDPSTGYFSVVRIPLQERRYNIHVGVIQNKTLLRNAAFVLTATAEVSSDSMRRMFPASVKIGPVEQIAQLVNVELSGIKIAPLPVAPPGLPFHANAVYFELDRSSEYFHGLATSGGIAVRVGDQWPKIQLELWAILVGIEHRDSGEGEPEVGKVYSGRVVKVVEFGAFVNFLGTHDGLLHISEMALHQVKAAGDVVSEGDRVTVKVLAIDDRGKVRLSMKGVNQMARQAAPRNAASADIDTPHLPYGGIDWNSVEATLNADLASAKAASGTVGSLRSLTEAYKTRVLDAWPAAQSSIAGSALRLMERHREAEARISTRLDDKVRDADRIETEAINLVGRSSLDITEETARRMLSSTAGPASAEPYADINERFRQSNSEYQNHVQNRPTDTQLRYCGGAAVPLFIILWVSMGFVEAIVIACLLPLGWVGFLTAHSVKMAKLRGEALNLARSLLPSAAAAKTQAIVAARGEAEAAQSALEEVHAREVLALSQSLTTGDATMRRFLDKWAALNTKLIDSMAAVVGKPTIASPLANDLTSSQYVVIGQKKLPSPPLADERAAGALAALTRAGGTTVPQHAFSVPLTPHFHCLADCAPLLIRRNGGTDARMASAIGAILLRCLMQIPPGKLLFTLVDPVGQGQNAARLLRLADHDERLVSTRAFSNRDDIRLQLKKLTEHIENVIQKYLRTEFGSIAEYNAKAGEIAEPYLALVIFDFPEKFDEECIAELRRILQNGPRCGVMTILVQDTALKPPYGADLDVLAQSCVTYDVDRNGAWTERGASIPGSVIPDEPPADDIVAQLIDRVGVAARDAFRVEVPFDKLIERSIMDGVGELWSGNTTSGIRIPLGPTGARKVQYLELGTGLSHHALVAGRPGSGKSNLMHIIITGAARIYDPSEIRLYLVDFKKGVEFQSYADARLPHADVIAVDSEREFGVSVLRGLKSKMDERNELFSRSGVPDLTRFRQKNAAEAMPRILLLVDEFQEFFSHDDSLAQEAALLLDQLVRMGRSAGIHVLLGSQTLAGAHSLPRSTVDLMAVRIALQCSEADSRLILGEDNPGARQLRRPGEGVYNAGSGAPKDNNFFQIALFKEEDRDKNLGEIQERACSGMVASNPIIFKGHQPADLGQCQALAGLRMDVARAPRHPTAWLGEAIAIRPPVSAEFTRQGGANMLVVAREEAEGVGVLAASLLALAAHPTAQQAQFHIVDLATADSEWAGLSEWLVEALGDQIQVYGRNDISDLFGVLDAELKRRLELKKPPTQPVYLAIVGLHRARSLRIDNDDDSLAATFARLLRDGPEVGVHTLTWVDGVMGLERVVDRRGLAEFGLRCASVLDARGSDLLFDSDIAAKLAGRPHRMVMSDESAVGVVHVFRPYAIPTKSWIRQYGADLRSRSTRDQEAVQ